MYISGFHNSGYSDLGVDDNLYFVPDYLFIYDFECWAEVMYHRVHITHFICYTNWKHQWNIKGSKKSWVRENK